MVTGGQMRGGGHVRDDKCHQQAVTICTGGVLAGHWSCRHYNFSRQIQAKQGGRWSQLWKPDSWWPR